MSIEYETAGGTARITVNRPERKNAMDAEAYAAMHAAVDRFTADKSCSVAIISARGEHFTVGGDMGAYTERPVDVWRRDGPKSPSVALQAALWACPKPIIVAVQGYCVGWGMVVLMAADVRILATDAKVGFTNLRVFGGAGTGGYVERALLQLPYTRAIDLLLTGRVVTAGEASAYGIATEVCERADLDARTDAWCERILETPPMVLRTVKAAARRLHDSIVSDLYNETERAGLAFLESHDFAEAMDAWRERRDPTWTGR